MRVLNIRLTSLLQNIENKFIISIRLDKKCYKKRLHHFHLMGERLFEDLKKEPFHTDIKYLDFKVGHIKYQETRLTKRFKKLATQKLCLY